MDEIKLTVGMKLVEEGEKFEISVEFDPGLPGNESEVYKSLTEKQKGLVGLAGVLGSKVLDVLEDIK